MTNSSSLYLPNAVAGKYGLSISLYNGDQRIDCRSKSIPDAIKRPIGMLADACYDAYLTAEKAKGPKTVDNSFFVSSTMKKRVNGGQIERITSQGECRPTPLTIKISDAWHKRFKDQWKVDILTVDDAMGHMLKLFNGQTVQWLNVPTIQAPKVKQTDVKDESEKPPEPDKPKPEPKKKESSEKPKPKPLDFSDSDTDFTGPIGFNPDPIPDGDVAIPSERNRFFEAGNIVLKDLDDDQSRAKRGCIHFMNQKFKLRGKTLSFDTNDLVSPPNSGSLRYVALKNTFHSLVNKLKSNDSNLTTDEKTLLVVLQGYHFQLFENMKHPWTRALKGEQDKLDKVFDTNKSNPRFIKKYKDRDGYFKYMAMQHLWNRMIASFQAETIAGSAVAEAISNPNRYLDLTQPI